MDVDGRSMGQPFVCGGLGPRIDLPVCEARGFLNYDVG